MSVELCLKPTQTQSFDSLHIYQLFQVDNGDEIWLKINDYWAVAINNQNSSRSLFEANTEVILLQPGSLDEEQ